MSDLYTGHDVVLFLNHHGYAHDGQAYGTKYWFDEEAGDPRMNLGQPPIVRDYFVRKPLSPEQIEERIALAGIARPNTCKSAIFWKHVIPDNLWAEFLANPRPYLTPKPVTAMSDAEKAEALERIVIR